MALKLRKNHSPTPPPECPLTTCMDFLGGAWTPNILWYLSGGPRRFSELKVDIPGISPKMLTTRLRGLTATGVVARTVKPTSPPSVEYALTDLGQELVPAIAAIVNVGHKLKARRAKLARQNARAAKPRRGSDLRRYARRDAAGRGPI